MSDPVAAARYENFVRENDCRLSVVSEEDNHGLPVEVGDEEGAGHERVLPPELTQALGARGGGLTTEEGAELAKLAGKHAPEESRPPAADRPEDTTVSFFECSMLQAVEGVGQDRRWRVMSCADEDDYDVLRGIVCDASCFLKDDPVVVLRAGPGGGSPTEGSWFLRLGVVKEVPLASGEGVVENEESHAGGAAPAARYHTVGAL